MVLGFLFDPTLSKVVLIRKNKPEWQAGLLNGVGGKIEPEESRMGAMVREFSEETGVLTNNWAQFLTLFFDGATVHCFFACGNVSKVQTTTSEEIGVFDVADVMNRCDTIPNIRWIVQMARSFYFEEPVEAGFSVFERTS